MSPLTSALLKVLVWSALTEFLLLRGLLRLGPVLPEGEALLPLYRLIELSGLAALNLAALSAAGAIGLFATGLDWRSPAEWLVGLSMCSAVIVNLGLGALLPQTAAGSPAVLQAGLTMIAVVGVIWLCGRRGRAPLALGLVATAQLSSLFHIVTHGVAGLGLELPGGGVAPFLAEALALAAALALPWSFRARPSTADVGLGVSLAVLFLATYLLRPWTIATFTMWTIAFTLFLPGPLYAVALGLATTTLLALRRQREGPRMAAGLLLVALGGLKLDFTYFALLSLVGLFVAGMNWLDCPSFGRAEPRLL